MEFITQEEYQERVKVAAYFVWLYRTNHPEAGPLAADANTDYFTGQRQEDALLEQTGVIIVEPGAALKSVGEQEDHAESKPDFTPPAPPSSRLPVFDVTEDAPSGD